MSAEFRKKMGFPEFVKGVENRATSLSQRVPVAEKFPNYYGIIGVLDAINEKIGNKGRIRVIYQPWGTEIALTWRKKFGAAERKVSLGISGGAKESTFLNVILPKKAPISMQLGEFGHFTEDRQKYGKRLEAYVLAHIDEWGLNDE